MEKDIEIALTDEELYEKVDKKLTALCNGTEKFTMHVPARPNEDFNLLVAEMMKRFKKLGEFKAYTHKRLDEAGIEKEPQGEHSKEGCRIGDRLDIVLNTPKLSYTITDKNIDDILCIAFEGGINYWCHSISVKDGDYKGVSFASDAVSKGATILINTREINKSKLLKAIERYVNEQDSTIIDLQTKEIDCGKIDASIADVIVQFAAFGKIIYG